MCSFAEAGLGGVYPESVEGCYKSAMQKSTTQLATSLDDSSRPSQNDAHATRFERPSIEEISLCCEISAYAPDGDDRPLF
jgi:hypothetical protein